ncbi:carbamoyltransferase C-terminal domain-containing protein [Pectobacterium sp. B2J-2]|uniref:carbamoyltransferase C-terminal domain-containing protein n=1 Tax=Pectobacterium sp. B2J-2 TaxID=3385372 RepID=UPI0038FC48AA
MLEFYKNNANVNFILKNAYQGSQISEMDVINHPKRCNHIGSISNIDYNQVASDLCEGPIVWVSGKSEIGPRALGHRSLLIDPRYQKSKDQLNKIKQREWWRPVAPIVLEEFMSDWFVDGFPSPYMLHAFHIHPDKKENVKAIAHLDGTARIQSLSLVQNKELYYVIKAFFKKTGIPMIGNTSLNDKGEPIIESFSQALDFALRKK